MRSLERPPAKLRARGLPGWLPWLARGHQHVSIWKKLLLEHDRADFALMISLLTFILNVGNFSRAFQQTDAGKVRKAMAKMMKAFEPELAKTMVAEREVVEHIETRLRSWQGHATIIAGRHGSGKSVALEEALRGKQGVYVHAVEDKDWKNSLYKELGLDNLGMLKDALRLVRKRNHGSTPILVLDIPRTTKEGATSATLVVLCLIRLGAGMDTVSTFAKILSSDSSLAHAGTRRLSRPASLCCGRVLCKLVRRVSSEVIVCASSAAMAIAFDAGGAERQDNFWVGDLTEDEAKELLNLTGTRTNGRIP